MILVLGGTTEGRKAVSVLDKAAKPFYYSTKSEFQKICSLNAVRITGALGESEMISFCIEHDIKVLVDAAHPFAVRLHAAVAGCATTLGIPVIRFERSYPERDSRFIWCHSYDDAVVKMNEDNISRLVAFTGVQSISLLRGYWKNHECYFRILDRRESLEIVEATGFPKDHLLFYDDDVGIHSLIERLHPEAIITKESGDSGGFSMKVEEAYSQGVKVYVIERPELSGISETVTGEYGLRRAIEKLLPGYYELRSGFSTGACATAAAKAALLALVSDEKPKFVSFHIPDGEVMWMSIHEVTMIDIHTAEASVIKDAGDDPDVTDGCRIIARVQLADHGEIRFKGGEGVGTVTLPGTGLEIGQPAINPVPRAMMRNELLQLYEAGCDVTISVPGGVEMAQKTFNRKIGILGGISIIGTSGIVMPFSNEAFIEAVGREIEVAKALGCERLVLNSGARSEKAVRRRYPDLPDAAFIHYGNAVGKTLEMAYRMDIKKITLGLMIGKAVKLAEGNLDTHSHKVVMNRGFLADVAEKAGCGTHAVATILGVNMASELWSVLSPEDSAKFFPCLLSCCWKVCRKCFRHGELTIMLITDSGNIVTTLNKV